MIGQDALTEERIALATPSGGVTRWSNNDLLVLTSRAVKNLVAEIYFPESRLTGTTVPNQQEYQIPDMHLVYRVYLNGQIIVEIPGGIDTLEGRQVLQYDQSAQGIEVAGSGGPAGAAGQMQAQWVVATPVAFPFLNTWGSPAPQAQGYFPGQRPRYYRRGGFLGIVPAPAFAASLVIDCVMVPAPIATAQDSIVVPDNYMDGIVNYVCYRAWGSDKDPVAQQQARTSLQDYTANIRKLRTWKRQYSLDNANTLVYTNRSFWRYGGRKTG